MLIRESVQPVFLAARSAEGKDWDVVVIQPGWSLNGVYYPADTLRAAVPLFEGLKVNAFRFGKPLGDEFDHLPDRVDREMPERFAENQVGWFENARYGSFKRKDGSTGEGILARFHVLEGADWLRKNLRDAWAHGRSDMLGFSINATGRARPFVRDGREGKGIEKINEVHSTEVVTEPAAGGEVLRLVASLGGEEKAMQEILRLIEEHRKPWLEGFDPPAEGEDVGDYVIRLLEANHERAAEAQSELGPDDEKLVEVARGVTTLNTVIGLLRQGQVADAMKLLRNWIAVYPMAEKGDAKTQRQGFYSFPYPASQTRYPGPGKLKPYGEKPPARREAKEDAMKTKDEATKVEEKRERELAAREARVRVREKLADANLPKQAAARVEELVTSREAVSDEDIDKAITAEREYIASLGESGKVTGLGQSQDDDEQVEVGEEKFDRVQKAFDGMFEGQDVDGVPAFTSLHEAFYLVHQPKRYLSREDVADLLFRCMGHALPTSPNREMDRHKQILRENWKGVAKDHLLREAVTTSDFSVAFGDALYRRLQKAYKDDPLNDWRQIVSSIENLTDATNLYRIVRIGGYGVLPTVNQGAPYQELTDPTELAENITPAKKGALAKFTWEDALADRLGVLRRVPTALGRSAARTVHELVWDQIDLNPTMADTVALFNAAHANYSTDVLSYTAVTDAIKRLRDQTEQNSAKKLGLNPAFLIVATEKENEAVEITDSAVKVSANEDSTVRSFVNKLGVKTFVTLGLGRGGANNKYYWYIAASPRDAETIAVGFLGGRDRPDIFVQSPADTPTSGAAFEADAITFKIRLVVGARVADWRWIQGNLATS